MAINQQSRRAAPVTQQAKQLSSSTSRQGNQRKKEIKAEKLRGCYRNCLQHACSGSPPILIEATD
jgi:hypothetical protein